MEDVPLVVDVGELEECLRFLKKINSAELRDIIWMRGDQQLIPDPQDIEQYKFYGLSNRYYPESAGWIQEL